MAIIFDERYRLIPRCAPVARSAAIAEHRASMEKQLGIALLPARLIGAVLALAWCWPPSAYGVMAYSLAARRSASAWRSARRVVQLVM